MIVYAVYKKCQIKLKIFGALCINICMNLAALGVRNALRSVESSIQVRFR